MAFPATKHKERREWLTKIEVRMNKVFKLERCPWPSFGSQPGLCFDGNSGGEQRVLPLSARP